VYLLFHDVYERHPGESGFDSPAADRYKLSLRQFEDELAALKAVESTALPFTLTFDDGGRSFFTIVADRLEALNWRGHCFVPTNYIDRPGFLTRREIRELHQRGHVIGSHSASHPARMHACAPQVIADEWRTSMATLEDIIGARIDSASVPGGWYGTPVATAAAGASLNRLLTSEPVCSPGFVDGCRIDGRFTIRQHSAPGLAARLVRRGPWSRWAMWAQWNAKAAVKPILGPFYIRVADWLMAQDAARH
jgi:peptidoglycan/xylan/chitin deacetylase (PgdA/CDA1 family)